MTAKKNVHAIFELGRVLPNGTREETFVTFCTSEDKANEWIEKQILDKKRRIKYLLLRERVQKSFEDKNPYPPLTADQAEPKHDPSFHNTVERSQAFTASVIKWRMEVYLPFLVKNLKARQDLQKQVDLYMKNMKMENFDVSDIVVTREDTYVVRITKRP